MAKQICMNKKLLFILSMLLSVTTSAQIVEGGGNQFFTCKGRTENYTYYSHLSDPSWPCSVTWTVIGGVFVDFNNSTTATLYTDPTFGSSTIAVKWTTDSPSGTITASTNTCPMGNSSKTINFQQRIPTTLTANPASVNLGATTTLTASPTEGANSFTWSAPASGNLLSSTGATVTAKPTSSTTYTCIVNFDAPLTLNGEEIKVITCDSKFTVNVSVVKPPITNNKITTTGTIYFTESGDADIINGSTATGGTGTITYQWQQRTYGTTTFTDIAGATGISYNPPATNISMYYRRVASSPVALQSISNEVIVTVIKGNTIHFGTTPDFSNRYYYTRPATPPAIGGEIPTGTSLTLNYSWVESSDGLNWHVVYGNDGQTQSTSSIIQTTYYARQVYINDPVTNNTVYNQLSNVIVAYVFDPISNNTICCNQTVYGTNTPAILTGSTPSGGNAPLSISWQSSTDQVNWILTNGSNLGNGNFQPNSGLIGDVYFRRIIRDNTPNNPATNTSNAVKLTYTNTYPVGSVITNPFPTSAFDSGCQEYLQTVNSLNGNFTNNYGGSDNDVYFRIISQSTLLGVSTCGSSAPTKSYLFDSNFNLITLTDVRSNCLFFQHLPIGTYYLLVEGNGTINLQLGTYVYSDCPDTYYDFIYGRKVTESVVPHQPSQAELDKISQIEIFPNPVKDLLQVKFATDDQGVKKIRIYDMQQKVLKSLEVSGTEHSLNTSDLTNGMYILVVETRSGLSQYKFVK
jgi:hypothetical protein